MQATVIRSKGEPHVEQVQSEADTLREMLKEARAALKVMIHAHESDNRVPPNLIADYRKLTG